MNAIDCVVSTEVSGRGAHVVYVDGYVDVAELKSAVEARGYGVSCIEPR